MNPKHLEFFVEFSRRDGSKAKSEGQRTSKERWAWLGEGSSMLCIYQGFKCSNMPLEYNHWDLDFLLLSQYLYCLLKNSNEYQEATAYKLSCLSIKRHPQHDNICFNVEFFACFCCTSGTLCCTEVGSTHKSKLKPFKLFLGEGKRAKKKK